MPTAAMEAIPFLLGNGAEPPARHTYAGISAASQTASQAVRA